MLESGFRKAIAAREGELPHPRFGIYRANVGMGLTTALAVRYPMLQRLLGDAGFLQLASDFIAAGHLPANPVLIDYGSEFPAFLSGHAFAQEVPFIAELADFESRWWRAYHAAEARPLEAVEFVEAAQDVEGLRFVFHPSAALLLARWPVGSLWQALQRGDAISDIERSPEAVLIWRPFAEVRVEIISPQRAEFLQHLMSGGDFAATVETISNAYPTFDLQSEFQALIAAEIITRIDRTP